MPTPVSIRYAVGDRAGLLTVVETDLRTPLTPSLERKGCAVGLRAVRVRCSCGEQKLVAVINLKNGGTVSCGHRRTEWQREGAHPRRGDGRMKHPSYVRWAGMMTRCYNPASPNYKNYGGRGITVWPQWHDSRVFLDYLDTVLGPPPEGHSIDRIDNDGNYEPGNLRWADRATQRRNQRSAAMLAEAS